MASGEASKIALALNFDMLASPNYAMMWGDGFSSPNPSVRNSSSVISQKFNDYFNSSDIPARSMGLGGGSDFYPFLLVGLPAGALATGAGAIKTLAKRTTFGGFANTPYDPCYHLFCDTVENINQYALINNAQAAAAVLQDLAEDKNVRATLGTA